MQNNKVQHDSEKLQPGQQVITACAFIYEFFDKVPKVFLPKRAETKKFLPGVYELPGGHIEFEEDIISGLKREISEEFQMHIDVGNVISCFTYMNNIKQTHSIEVVYFAKFSDKINQIKLNLEDHSEYIWLAENEINKILSINKNGEDPEIKIICQAFQLLHGLDSIIRSKT